MVVDAIVIFVMAVLDKILNCGLSVTGLEMI